MPTLYSGLHLLSHDKPSYVSYERASTFDAAEFPDRAFVYPVADPTDHATNEELRAMSEAMKRRILEINAEDPRRSSGYGSTTCGAAWATTGSWRRASTRHA